MLAYFVIYLAMLHGDRLCWTPCELGPWMSKQRGQCAIINNICNLFLCVS